MTLRYINNQIVIGYCGYKQFYHAKPKLITMLFDVIPDHKGCMFMYYNLCQWLSIKLTNTESITSFGCYIRCKTQQEQMCRHFISKTPQILTFMSDIAKPIQYTLMLEIITSAIGITHAEF
jgi:hypothetical protein